MTLILGMDIYVFIAWIGTILATLLCIIYGVYHEFIKNKNTKKEPVKKTKKAKNQEE